MVAISTWYHLGFNQTASATTSDFSFQTTTASTSWSFNISWSDYVEICKEIIRQSENKLRLEIQRKSLFVKKLIPKFQSTRKPRTQLFIPAQKNFKCRESRSR